MAALRVLEVEDSPTYARHIQALLEHGPTPMQCVRAPDLASGLSAWRESGADVVLLDLSLPDAQGLEALDAFRAEANETPIIVITANQDPQVLAATTGHGAAETLNKNEVRASALHALVRRVAEENRARLARRNQAREVAKARIDPDRLRLTAHDVRAPLTALRLNVAVLRRDPAIASTHTERLNSMDRSVQALCDILDDLLDLSLLAANEWVGTMASFPAKDLVHCVASQLHPVAEARGVHLEASASAGDVVADRRRLTQALTNLVHNAIKFTPPGGTVHVEALPTGEQWLIRVSDTGIGLSPAELASIWQGIERGTHEGQGTGLGLRIVRSVVEAHGGTIAADSPGPGKGTSFTLRLPHRPTAP